MKYALFFHENANLTKNNRGKSKMVLHLILIEAEHVHLTFLRTLNLKSSYLLREKLQTLNIMSKVSLKNIFCEKFVLN